MLSGIDVSVWQGKIRWDGVKADKVFFAFIKASEGTNIRDPFFQTNWSAALAAGITRGAYHYFRPKQDVKAQAELFASLTLPLLPGDLPLALDVEDDGALTPIVLQSKIKECLDEIRRLSGKTPIIYTGPGFWNNFVAVDNAPIWTDAYPLWVAHYTRNRSPMLPKGFASWSFWQYSDSTAVSGVSGKVDGNWYNGDVESFTKFTGGSERKDEALALASQYKNCLVARDAVAMLTLYNPDAVRGVRGCQVQGTTAVLEWYTQWLPSLDNNCRVDCSGLEEIPSSPGTWLLRWDEGAATFTDTIVIRGGKIQYHVTLP